MSLKKNNLQLSLNQGINTKIDPKQLPFGQFTHIENAKLIKRESIIKDTVILN